jgi:dihydropteroate synthase
MDALTLPHGRALDLTRTRVMGTLNATPDSFFPGSRLDRLDEALGRAAAMIEAGAAILDVGGESSRPGADPVEADEESRRVVPLVEAIRARWDVPISVDTVKPEVARRALEAGADVINDITALAAPEMAGVAVDAGAAVVLMHMRGTPRTMQRDTRYDDVVLEVRRRLVDAAESARAAGIPGDKIVVDPGIGFGKDVRGNLELLRRLPELVSAGWPVLVGASRKRFIGAVLDLPVEDRLEGSLAVAALAAWAGARLIRVHDVRETVRIVRMVDAVRDPRTSCPAD